MWTHNQSNFAPRMRLKCLSAFRLLLLQSECDFEEVSDPTIIEIIQ